MTNRWRRFLWLSIGIAYQYQSIDKLLSIGCRLTGTELTHKKHNFVRSNCKHVSFYIVMSTGELSLSLHNFERVSAQLRSAVCMVCALDDRFRKAEIILMLLLLLLLFYIYKLYVVCLFVCMPEIVISKLVSK